MRTLDRYIIRQFLLNFLILTAVLMTLFVLVSLLLELDEFLDAARHRQAEQGGLYLLWLGYLLVDYFGPMVLMLYGFMSGLLVVAAMGFTLTFLHRHGEVVAMAASGISLYRVAAPLLVVGALLNALVLPLQEYVIPRLAGKLARAPNQVRYDIIQTFAVNLSPDGRGHLLSAREYDPARERLSAVIILERVQPGGSDAGRETRRRITADAARWSPERGGWELENGKAIVRDLGPDLRREEAVDLFATDLSPQVLLARRAAIYSRLLSLAELRQMAGNPAADHSLMRQIMHGRFSLLAVNVLILVLALPFFLMLVPASFLRQSGLSAATTLAAWGAAVILMQVSPARLVDWAGPGLAGMVTPATTAWLPVALLLPLALWRLHSIRS